jgi:uncharacterized protein YdcH (DUF465 family)
MRKHKFDMSEENQKLFNEFIDLIEVLKQKDKCNCPNFQKIWINKKQNINKRINQLPQKDLNEIEIKFKEWSKQHEVADPIRPTR